VTPNGIEDSLMHVGGIDTKSLINIWRKTNKQKLLNILAVDNNFFQAHSPQTGGPYA
jgi:hypothetical protein